MSDRFAVDIEGLEVPLPRMAPVRQHFDTTRVDDVGAAVRAQLEQAEIAGRIRPGARIAVGCGSRGVANVGEAVKAVVDTLKAHGAEPFVFPAMGSHGSATAEGQKQVLAGYGISREALGVSVRASMETVVLGELDDGTPIHVDRHAQQADGVVLVNRIKPHTTFRGPVESGILKMLAIGMGKIAGATVLHTHGMDTFGTLIPTAAEYILQRMPVLFGVGLIENAHDETAVVEAIPAERLQQRGKIRFTCMYTSIPQRKLPSGNPCSGQSANSPQRYSPGSYCGKSPGKSMSC